MKRTREHINYENSTEELARFAKALSHPTRIAILKFLENQSCSCTGDLMKVLPLAQSTISQHIKELKNAGLIEGELNPPKINYKINQKKWENARRLFEVLFAMQNTCITNKC